MRTAVLEAAQRFRVQQAPRPGTGPGRSTDPAGGLRRVRLQSAGLGRPPVVRVPAGARRARSRRLGGGGGGRRGGDGRAAGGAGSGLTQHAFAEQDLANAACM